MVESVYFASTYNVYQSNVNINFLQEVESRIDELSDVTSCNIKKLLALPNLKCIIASSLGYVNDMEPKWNLLIDWLQTYFHLATPPLIISNTCCSSIDALEIAQCYIQSYKYEYIFVISFDFAHQLIINGLKSYNLLAKDNMSNGLKLTSSVVCTLLSKREFDCNSRAEIISCNVLNDANSITSIDSSGRALKLAIIKSIAEAGININNLHSILAAYNGVKENDAMINRVLSLMLVEDMQIKIVKSKLNIGHSLGSSGILEISIYIDNLINNYVNMQYKTMYLLYISTGFSGVVSAMVFKL